MLAHALFPQIPQGLIPVVVQEGENLFQVPVFKSVDVLSQLFQSTPSLGFTVRIPTVCPSHDSASMLSYQ